MDSVVSAVNPDIFFFTSAFAFAGASSLGMQPDGVAFERVNVKVTFVTVVVWDDLPFFKSMSVFVEKGPISFVSGSWIGLNLVVFNGVLEFRSTYDPLVADDFFKTGGVVELEFQSDSGVAAKIGVNGFGVVILFSERIGFVVPTKLPFIFVALVECLDGVVGGVIDGEVEHMGILTGLVGTEWMFLISGDMVVGGVKRLAVEIPCIRVTGCFCFRKIMLLVELEVKRV